MLKKDEKDIARRLYFPVSKIDGRLNDILSHTILKHSSFQKYMNWRESKSTKNIKDMTTIQLGIS